MHSHKLRSLIAIVSLITTAAIAASAVTRHVAATGTDVGNSTLSTCLTMTYAVSQASAGEAVIVASGTYAAFFDWRTKLGNIMNS